MHGRDSANQLMRRSRQFERYAPLIGHNGSRYTRCAKAALRYGNVIWLDISAKVQTLPFLDALRNASILRKRDLLAYACDPRTFEIACLIVMLAVKLHNCNLKAFMFQQNLSNYLFGNFWNNYHVIRTIIIIVAYIIAQTSIYIFQFMYWFIKSHLLFFYIFFVNVFY